MSLEECKRLADEKLKIMGKRRCSTGMVAGEKVWIYIAGNSLPWPRHKPWVVVVYAYGEISSKYFKQREPADRYFEELLRKHGLTEEATP